MASIQTAETTSRESSRTQFLDRLGLNSQIAEVVSMEAMFVTADMKSVIVRLCHDQFLPPVIDSRVQRGQRVDEAASHRGFCGCTATCHRGEWT